MLITSKQPALFYSQTSQFIQVKAVISTKVISCFLPTLTSTNVIASGADTGFYLTTAKKKKKKKKEGVTIIYAHNAYGVIFPVPDTYAAETFQALPFTEEL